MKLRNSQLSRKCTVLDLRVTIRYF